MSDIEIILNGENLKLFWHIMENAFLKNRHNEVVTIRRYYPFISIEVRSSAEPNNQDLVRVCRLDLTLRQEILTYQLRDVLEFLSQEMINEVKDDHSKSVN